jgi:hypothetical protein
LIVSWNTAGSVKQPPAKIAVSRVARRVDLPVGVPVTERGRGRGKQRGRKVNAGASEPSNTQRKVSDATA